MNRTLLKQETALRLFVARVSDTGGSLLSGDEREAWEQAEIFVAAEPEVEMEPSTDPYDDLNQRCYAAARHDGCDHADAVLIAAELVATCRKVCE